MTDTRAPLGDVAFDAAWSRITLMMRNPEQFSTLFVFNGNDLRKQALFARLTQTSQAQERALLWPITSALSEPLGPLRSQPPHVVDALVTRVLQRCLDAEPEHALTPITAPPLALIVLELDDSLARRLHDAYWPNDATFDPASAVAEQLRMALLSRLNERREQLAKRAPLLVVLPKTWTRHAALYAPDLWTVRLTSLYLQAQQQTAQAHTEASVTRPVPHWAELSNTGTLTPAHHRILQQWVQAIDQGQTDNLVTSDGWAAVQTSLLLGDSPQALRLATAVLELAYQRDKLRDQMVSQNWLGYVYVRLGQLEEALEAYQIGHMVAQQLAASDPKNSDWQRDLSVSFDNVTGILEAQGEREQALAQYRKSLAIREKLAASDPKNSDWQRDLSVSYEKVAGILEAQGEREQALAQYRKSLAIREKLAASDPKNSDWQRDLSVSFNNVAGILEAQGEREQALAQYRKSSAIMEKLAASDPKNAQWQADLGESFWMLASVEPNTSQKTAWLDKALAVLQDLKAKGALSAQQNNWMTVIEKEKARLAPAVSVEIKQ